MNGASQFPLERTRSVCKLNVFQKKKDSNLEVVTGLDYGLCERTSSSQLSVSLFNPWSTSELSYLHFFPRGTEKPRSYLSLRLTTPHS